MCRKNENDEEGGRIRVQAGGGGGGAAKTCRPPNKFPRTAAHGTKTHKKKSEKSIKRESDDFSKEENKRFAFVTRVSMDGPRNHALTQEARQGTEQRANEAPAEDNPDHVPPKQYHRLYPPPIPPLPPSPLGWVTLQYTWCNA